jgi:signal transduction histidine kinase
VADDRAERERRIRELEEQVRLLREENDLLAEAQADAVLLGTLADHLGRGGEPGAILRVALEQISVLKDLPVCAACERRGATLEVVAAHVAISHWPLEGALVPLPPARGEELEAGAVLVQGGDARALVPAADALTRFTATAALLLPFRVQGRPPGALLFCTDGPPERLAGAVPVLQRAAEAIRFRLDRLALSEALHRLATQLDAQVVERTRELGASEARLRAALEAVSMGTFEWDLDSGAVVWSGVAELMGLGAAGLAPDLGSYLANVDEADRPAVEATLAAARAAGGTGGIRLEHRAAGPRPRILELHGRGVPGDAGGPRRIAGVVVDVTERRALEASLLQGSKMESLGRLAGGIAHDFNNLLTTILGGAELLLEETSLAPAAREDLVAVRDAARRAAELTRRLLAVSRKQPLEIRPVAVDEVARGLAPILTRLMGSDVDLRLDVAPALPPVLADAAQLEQILLNFAANARDAMPRGGTLSVSLGPETVPPGSADPPPGAYVRLAVSDSGVGMPRDVAARIFEPFFTTKERGAGTGLGLAIVYGIVKQHGGAIGVTSAPGLGTRFDVLLPAAPPGPSVDPGARRGLS